jgi:hypothetical protein
MYDEVPADNRLSTEMRPGFQIVKCGQPGIIGVEPLPRDSVESRRWHPTIVRFAGKELSDATAAPVHSR